MEKKLFDKIMQVIDAYEGLSEKFLNNCVMLEKEMKKLNKGEKEKLAKEIYNNTKDEKIEKKVFLYSIIIGLTHNPEILREYIECVIHNTTMDYLNKYFLFFQFERMVFMNPEYDKKEVLLSKWKLLESIKEEVNKKLGLSLRKMDEKTLNPNFAIVITNQFLSAEHGPTKTALDRCIVLKKYMKKEVLLINTGDFMSIIGYMPILEFRIGNYNESYTENSIQNWKGENIAFFQCDKNVIGNLSVFEMLIQTIQKYRPSIVIDIGGLNLFSGLLNEMIPVLTIGTTQSGLCTTLTDYQMIHGQLDEKWKYVIKELNKPTDYLIEGRFTFSLKKQIGKTTRKIENIPENQFILVVIGGRLDEEITDEFMDMLDGILSEKIGIVFIGIFEKFGLMASRHKADYMYYMGAVKDVLSKLEVCDLYINPIRKGGATSAVEAMSKGKPVLTVAYGDVAGTVGEEFCCQSYAEMAKLIRLYQKDAIFYKQKSQEALNLAEKYLDDETEFSRIVNEYQRRKSKKG